MCACVLYKYHLHTNRYVFILFFSLSLHIYYRFYLFFTSESVQLLIGINNISVCMLNVLPASAGSDDDDGGGSSVVV